MSDTEVVVTLDGRPRPATVVERGPERTLVRFRDAGTFREQWVPNSAVVSVETGSDRGTLLKLIGLAVVGVIGLVLLLLPGSNKTLSQALPSGDPTPTPTATASPVVQPTASPSESPAASTITTAVIFGDSFVAGRGLAAGQPTAVQLAVKQLGWKATILPGDGTGFTTGGKRGGQPYAVRLQALTTAPQVLVLEGGASDTGATPEDLTAKAGAVIDDLTHRFPSTKIIVMGPIAMEQPPDGQLVRVDGTLRAVAKSHGVTYLDPIAQNWITPANAPDFTADIGFYPNEAGSVFLGNKMAKALAFLTR